MVDPTGGRDFAGYRGAPPPVRWPGSARLAAWPPGRSAARRRWRNAGRRPRLPVPPHPVAPHDARRHQRHGIRVLDVGVDVCYPELLIGDRFQTLATLMGRSFLLMRNEALGSTTAAVLLMRSVTIVVASAWAARRMGQAS